MSAATSPEQARAGKMPTDDRPPLRIWIDVANSPHVLFFAPIVRDLRASGHVVELTGRDFAQTLDLARLFGLEVRPIGVHGGRNALRKALNIAGRAMALRRFARGRRYDLAISHNSYSHCIAARWLAIPTITLMDYEFQAANHVAFRLADMVMVPEVFPDDALRRFGASPDRTFRYKGLKEEVYLQDYAPDRDYHERIKACGVRAGVELDQSHVLATLRPPATMALYHRFENPLFVNLLEYLGHFDHARLIVLPRTREQARSIGPHLPGNAFIPDEPLDGRHLIYSSDLVISAGGTMNREAAVLGTPVYSIFAGRLGAVDRHLVQENRMVLVRSRSDFEAIRLEKKAKPPERFDFKLRAVLVEKFIEFANSRRKQSSR